MLTPNSQNIKSSIALPPTPHSPIPQNLPTFDPYSPFWILVGLAIVLKQSRSKPVKSEQNKGRRRY